MWVIEMRKFKRDSCMGFGACSFITGSHVAHVVQLSNCSAVVAAIAVIYSLLFCKNAVKCRALSWRDR